MGLNHNKHNNKIRKLHRAIVKVQTFLSVCLATNQQIQKIDMYSMYEMLFFRSLPVYSLLMLGEQELLMARPGMGSP